MFQARVIKVRKKLDYCAVEEEDHRKNSLINLNSQIQKRIAKRIRKNYEKRYNIKIE